MFTENSGTVFLCNGAINYVEHLVKIRILRFFNNPWLFIEALPLFWPQGLHHPHEIGSEYHASSRGDYQLQLLPV
jgi:hypothetical protein